MKFKIKHRVDRREQRDAMRTVLDDIRAKYLALEDICESTRPEIKRAERVVEAMKSVIAELGARAAQMRQIADECAPLMAELDKEVEG